MRFLIPSLFLVFAVGCGGSVTEAPVTDEDSGATGDDTGTTTTDDSSVTPTDDSSVIPTDDAIVPGDETTPVADGSVPPTDSGTKPGTIACGMTTCDPKTQECCVTFGGGSTSSKCVDTGKCMGGATLACTDSTVCATGEVCCARFGGGGSGAECSKTCMGTRLCSTDSECRMGEKCQTSMFTGLKSCRMSGGFGDAGSFFDAKAGG
jgi:hypothetical protein